jgi:hypothetical protein
MSASSSETSSNSSSSYESLLINNEIKIVNKNNDKNIIPESPLGKKSYLLRERSKPQLSKDEIELFNSLYIQKSSNYKNSGNIKRVFKKRHKKR